MSQSFDAFVRAMRDDSNRHIDGVPWYSAPAPFVFHRHKAHTKGALGGDEVWRCPCGAIGGPGQPWVLLDRRDVSWLPLWGSGQREEAGMSELTITSWVVWDTRERKQTT